MYPNRIDVSEGTDINKTSASKECDICYYWYFLNYGLKSEPNVCIRCHDLLLMSINFSDIAILNTKASYYRCIISLISNKKAVKLMQILICPKKVEHYKAYKTVMTYKNG